MKVSIVIAAFDEAANVEPLVRRLASRLAGQTDLEWDLLFVVEGRDGTREVLEGLRAEIPQLRISYQPEPSGLGNAFRRGFAAVPADADYVVTLDADLNHHPEAIPDLLAAAREQDLDVLVGSRFVAGSRVVGSPLWKRALSISVNRLMGLLYGLEVADKTSGFRVYRAEVLRRVVTKSPGFAFLPELLIGARAAGYRVDEVPIDFVFRREGSSKMVLGATAVSYLGLFCARFGVRSWLVLALLLAGFGLRVVASYPVHKFPADGDCALTGLCAFRVLRGETPVFFSHVRIGSLGGHLAALLFLWFGPGRWALALGPVVVGCAFLLAGHFFFRELLGRERATLALVFLALPPPAVLFWLYMPTGYPETLLLCAVVLWLAVRLARLPDSRPTSLGLGLAMGLGWWSSLLSLACTGPALAWLAWRRPSPLRRAEPLLRLGTGFVLGAAPWLAYNLRYPLGSFQDNFASRPAAGFSAVLGNVGYFFSYSVPELIASLSPIGFTRPNALQQSLHGPTLIAVSAACALALLRPSFFALGGEMRSRALARWALLVAVAAGVVAVNAFSEAGMTRGLTVRYVLPLALVIPPLLAVSLDRVRRRSRWLAAASIALVVGFNLSGVYWPWGEDRLRWEREVADDASLLALLEREGVDLVMGNYWLTYPLNFLSHERIVALPEHPEFDHYALERRLAQRGVKRWALVSRVRAELRAWKAAGGWHGRVVKVGEQIFVFLPEVPPAAGEAPGELAAELRAAAATARQLGPPPRRARS